LLQNQCETAQSCHDTDCPTKKDSAANKMLPTEASKQAKSKWGNFCSKCCPAAKKGLHLSNCNKGSKDDERDDHVNKNVNG